VGRLAREKNVPLAIEAARAMRHGGVRIRPVVVGDGPLRAGLQSTHPDLVFCGMQRGEALATHYASADVLLFPSETETFGNVVLEGLASGLVVVAYDYAAARAHVTDGASGFLAPYGDAAAFVARAAAVAREAHGLGEVRLRAREVAQRLDWERVVQEFEQLLEEAARGVGTGVPGPTRAPGLLRAEAV
jgi:glycosyltransferase involved in cell wall biosynthesis